jgi:ABC-type transporter MlaC component
MKQSSTNLLSAAILGLSLSLAGPALAGRAEDSVKQMHAAVLADDVSTLDSHVDYESIAKASLEGHWDEFTADEQQAFVGDFRTIVRRAYRKGLQGKNKGDLRFSGESASPNGPVVHTRVKITPTEPEIGIDYLMRCDDSCRLIDVVTDGSSLVKSWQRMFRRIIKKHGKAELLSRISKKAKSDD